MSSIMRRRSASRGGTGGDGRCVKVGILRIILLSGDVIRVGRGDVRNDINKLVFGMLLMVL